MTTVRIQSSHLLNERFELPTQGLSGVVSRYKRAWAPKEKRIVRGLEKVTGLTFTSGVTYCFITNPSRRNYITNPLIIDGGFTPKEFTYLLIHQLVHYLATDNLQNYNWHEVARQLYPGEDPWVAEHIMVFTVIEAYFTRVAKNIDHVIWYTTHTHKFDYPKQEKRAWDIVSDKDYKVILEKLKKKQKVTKKKFA